MPPNRLATSGGQCRRCSTVPRFPADAAVIVAVRTRSASVLRPRRRSAEQRLASLESNGAQCILQCLTMAIKLRHVFSRRPLTEITPLSGNTSPPCIQNELVLARYAPHVFKMPCKAPFGNTSRGYLAIKTPFSRPNPSNHAQWANIATLFRLVFHVGALRFLSAWELGARPALRFVLHCGISVFPRVKAQTL